MALGRMLGARLLQVVIVLFAISLLTFLLLSLLPGSAAEYRIGPLPDFSPQQRAEIVARLTKQLGLNRALPIQYGIWLWHALKGDLGLTTEGEPVTQLLGSRLGATIELAIAGLIPSIIASLLLATWSFRTRWRRGQGTLQAVMSTFFVLPSFWLAFLLVLAFSVKIPVLPASGFTPFSQSPVENMRHLVLPAVTLAVPLTALFYRYFLAGLEEAAMGDFVVAARSKGISERAVAYRHILPNGVLPAITIVGIATASLLSSLVVIESVFSWPGLGSLLVQAVTEHDYNTLVAIVLLTAIAFVITSFIVDVAYWLIDPRTRRAAAL